MMKNDNWKNFLIAALLTALLFSLISQINSLDKNVNKIQEDIENQNKAIDQIQVGIDNINQTFSEHDIMCDNCE